MTSSLNPYTSVFTAKKFDDLLKALVKGKKFHLLFLFSFKRKKTWKKFDKNVKYQFHIIYRSGKKIYIFYSA